MKLKRFLLRYYPPGAERFSDRIGRKRGRETVAEANSCGKRARRGRVVMMGKAAKPRLGVRANGACRETGRRGKDNGESEGGAAGRAIQREREWWKCRRKDPEKRQRANGGQSFTAPDFIVQLKLTRPVVDLKVNFSGA